MRDPGGAVRGPSGAPHPGPAPPAWAAHPSGIIYRLLAYGATGAAGLLHRLSPDPAARRDLAERLATGEALEGDLPRGAIWAHAASMGEVRALASLARALVEAGETRPFFVTTQSATGRRLAHELGFASQLAPADHPAVLARFLGTLEPPLHLVVETEIWPWRLSLLRRLGVPTAIVSARLSPRRWPRYRRLRALYGAALSEVALLCPASEGDRDRFAALGVPAACFGPVGNLKWDAAPPPLIHFATQALRVRAQGLDPALAWIVLGSCHPGEAAPFTALATGPERSALLVAPQHPERFDELAAELQSAGLPLQRASSGAAPAGTRALLLDRMGVLPRAYPLAAAATPFWAGARTFLPAVADPLREAGVRLRGCERTREILPDAEAAAEEDWYREYLDLILSVRVVRDLDEAIAHIEKYGSLHTEAIVTESYERAQRFLHEVNSSTVLVNASTRFSDGFELGLGAEIGISTTKLHAFGPMGLEELTTTKFIIYGNGQVRT